RGASMRRRTARSSSATHARRARRCAASAEVLAGSPTVSIDDGRLACHARGSYGDGQVVRLAIVLLLSLSLLPLAACARDGGDGSARKWSNDLVAMDRRIEAAFREAGAGELRDVVVIGYSQGAERAERLVARWPEKYAAAILMASPIEPSPRDLGSLSAVVT